MATIVTPTFTEKVVRGLRKAADELEEFAVQASLGEMEARELFEKSKKKYRKSLFDAVVKYEKAKEVTKAAYKRVRAAVEDLQVQLALGKAESKDKFDDQRKRIRSAIAKVQNALKRKDVPDKMASDVGDELKKLKIKLDILKLKAKKQSASAKQEFRTRKKDFTNRLRIVRDKFQDRRSPRVKHFNAEIDEAWKHLKKAFTAKKTEGV